MLALYNNVTVAIYIYLKNQYGQVSLVKPLLWKVQLRDSESAILSNPPSLIWQAAS